MSSIEENIRRIFSELPPGVRLVVAAKGRSVSEVKTAIENRAGIIGENYVQEAEQAFKAIGNAVQWHCIGHLQKNKVKSAVAIFDMIETVDSIELAREIDKRCKQIDKTMPVLIEVNSGREENKSGVFPEDVIRLGQEIAGLKNVRLVGLMTMGPTVSSPEESRPYFKLTMQVLEEMKKIKLPGVEMESLSMGMTDSYRVAVEEGANIVRIGTGIFGAVR
jgi:pyridoxal phosphate enzyme (YggS family)